MFESVAIEFWGIVGFASLLVLIFLRVPIAIAMATVGILGGTLLAGIKPTGLTFAASAFESVFPYSLSVIPLFILMGVLNTRRRCRRRSYIDCGLIRSA